MKNILTISITDIIINYIDSKSEMIKEHVRDHNSSSVRITCDIINSITDELMSMNTFTVAKALQRMFYQGDSMLMLADKLDQLEAWYHKGEDYLVVVVDTDNKMIAAFTPNQIQY